MKLIWLLCIHRYLTFDECLILHLEWRVIVQLWNRFHSYGNETILHVKIMAPQKLNIYWSQQPMTSFPLENWILISKGLAHCNKGIMSHTTIKTPHPTPKLDERCYHTKICNIWTESQIVFTHLFDNSSRVPSTI